MKLELVLVAVWLGACLCAPQRGTDAIQAPKAPAATAGTATSLAAPRDNRASRTSRQDYYRGDTRYADSELQYYLNYSYTKGWYMFRYVQRDSVREESELRNEGRDDEHIVVRGHYGYRTPDGRYFFADDQRYKPEIEEKQPGFSPPPTTLPPSMSYPAGGTAGGTGIAAHLCGSFCG